MFENISNNFKTITLGKYYRGQIFKQLVTYNTFYSPGSNRKQKRHFFNTQIVDFEPTCIYIKYDMVLITTADNGEYKHDKHFDGFITIPIDDILMVTE